MSRLMLFTLALMAALLMAVPGWAEAPAEVPLANTPVFNHAIHAEQDLGCADCHQWQATVAAESARMPRVESCTDCHEDDGLAVVASQPASHVPGYRFEHKYAARDKGDDCAICHRESESCTVCHHGEAVDFVAHDRNWAVNHPLTFYKGTEDCTACHEPRGFCNDCHEANGIQPANHYYSDWKSPALHGEEARLDLGTCVQCHNDDEPVCIKCHGTLSP